VAMVTEASAEQVNKAKRAIHRRAVMATTP